RQANLRLDTREGALARTASGRAAIVPGKPDASNLMARVQAKSPIQMPPPASGKKLTAADIAVLRKWIAQGAEYAPHWAFVPPKQPAVPSGPHPMSPSSNTGREGEVRWKTWVKN